ncbi:Nipped-B-like protein [Wickerhamomyces ciferrii]|uniref:Nipped-B-like protein n=1 Tax=Wickerhamomyces ciferrii (strain ATCC 14091 / BCRC 22168 / CBS 111 / JCM 3599 / NBRC 0793 / NRRL Y-1031 F-60-10) TaxID=1206466 RepID=K0KT67_WICCF|nr:Nipped-B-like protein [Wickerhamomyces ciferrii]CCH46346.1 Nipped-B-like protein [Wickerhamomyces ciferrii]
MTLQQASTVPIKNGDSIETVTLKNLVALDLVEKNENILKLFKLFNDSNLKFNLSEKLTKEKLNNLIEENKKQIEIEQDELKKLKQNLNESNNKDNELINNLSKEFLSKNNNEQIDNTNKLIENFEKENNVQIKYTNNPNFYNQHSINFGLKIDSKPEFQPEPIDQPEQQQQQHQPEQPEQQQPKPIPEPQSQQYQQPQQPQQPQPIQQ